MFDHSKTKHAEFSVGAPGVALKTLPGLRQVLQDLNLVAVEPLKVGVKLVGDSEHHGE